MNEKTEKKRVCYTCILKLSQKKFEKKIFCKILIELDPFHWTIVLFKWERSHGSLPFPGTLGSEVHAKRLNAPKLISWDNFWWRYLNYL